MWLALAAALLFWASVFGFAAVRGDYSHASDAVSELGVWGAPNMWGFNILGYIAPGLLLGAACWMIARRVRPEARVLPALLGWSGWAITLAGASPADLAHMDSPWTIFHAAGSITGILAWLPGVIWLGIASLRTQRALTIACFAGIALMVGAFALYAVLMPGLVQRTCFAVLFGWTILAAAISARATAQIKPPSAPHRAVT